MLALLCAAAWLVFALTSQRQFPHLNGWTTTSETASAPTSAVAGGDGGAAAGAEAQAVPGGLTQELGPYAVLAAGVVLGALALRKPGRGQRACAVLALVLLVPFTADVVLFPLGSAPLPDGLGALLFHAVTAGLTLLVLCIAWRAAAHEAAARNAPGVAAEHGATTSAAQFTEARRPPQARRPARRWAVRLAVMLASIAVTLLLAEAIFRALDLRAYSNPVLIVPGAERRILLSEVALFRPSERPPGVDGLAARFRPYLYLKGWYDRPQWAYFDEQGCVDYVFNRWGLRDHDFELRKRPGDYRIVAIGDSFTFGIGAQLEDCWTEVLERTLAARADRPVEVINAGFSSGHHPGMYAPWIARDGVKLQPDVLIVGLCLNDMHPGVEMYAYETPEPPVVLDGKSVLASYLALQVELRKHPGHRVRDFTDRVLEEPAQWETCQAALRASKAALDAAGIRMLVVPFPMLSGLGETNYPYTRLLAMVRDFCAEAGIECVDLLPELLGQQDELLWAHPTDQHPNDKGHALIAAGIARYLAQH